MMSVVYRLTQSELKTLVKGSGYSDITGLPLETGQLTREEIAASLNRMMKNGLLTNTNGGFQAEDDLHEVVRAITRDRYVHMRSRDVELPDLYVYHDNRAVICSARGGGSFRVIVADGGETAALLTDEGYLPDDSYDAVCGGDLPDEALRAFDGASLHPADDALDFASAVVFFAECRSACGEYLSGIRVIEHGGCLYVRLEDADEASVGIYDISRVLKMLEEMIWYDR